MLHSTRVSTLSPFERIYEVPPLTRVTGRTTSAQLLLRVGRDRINWASYGEAFVFCGSRRIGLLLLLFVFVFVDTPRTARRGCGSERVNRGGSSSSLPRRTLRCICICLRSLRRLELVSSPPSGPSQIGSDGDSIIIKAAEW